MPEEQTYTSGGHDTLSLRERIEYKIKDDKM